MAFCWLFRSIQSRRSYFEKEKKKGKWSQKWTVVETWDEESVGSHDNRWSNLDRSSALPLLVILFTLLSFSFVCIYANKQTNKTPFRILVVFICIIFLCVGGVDKSFADNAHILFYLLFIAFFMFFFPLFSDLKVWMVLVTTTTLFLWRNRRNKDSLKN